MWIVTLAKNSEFLKTELTKKISDAKIYFPKVKIKKNKVKNILGNYLFCYSDKFSINKHLTNNLRSLKGIKQILFAEKYSQKEISDFILNCKKHEDGDGFIKNSFFKSNIIHKGKILNGPFSNYIFNVLHKEKKRIKVLIGDVEFSISDNSKFHYSSV